MKKNVRALLLMSGGLDSLLAAKALQNQEISVTPLCFKSFFFDCANARKTCQQLGLKLMEVDFSKKHLKLIKSPKYGFGSAINPCIDCHLLMLKEAKKIMVNQGFDFIATGEVLGERPMSQNQRAMDLIERKSRLTGYLLRPLSAKALPETIPEKNKQIDRTKLYQIVGRSRKPQLKLVKDFGLKEFISPGGGCILTEKNFADNLKKFLAYKKNPNNKDILLLRQGRIFWEQDVLIVVARDKGESEKLKQIKDKKDFYLEPKNFSGPSVIVRAFKKRSSFKMYSLGEKYLLQFSKNIPSNYLISH